MLHSYLVGTAKKYGARIAIEQENGQTITYKVLDQLSNRFANCFEELKTSLSIPYIGILSSIHIESIAAVLGCLKMGCAYIPLDDYAPVDRLAHIINASGLDILVIDASCHEKYQELLSHPNIRHTIILNGEIDNLPDKCLSIDHLKKYSTCYQPSHKEVADSLAYILHTSGSTGVPKGIMLTHRNARTFVDWMHKEFTVVKEDIIMSRAPFKFDLSIFDIFNTLKAGAKLICYDWDKKREHKHADYVGLMERTKATILYTTPSTFITLMNHGELSSAKLSLSRIMYAGEPFLVPQLKRLMACLPYTRVANIYGPTETNIITYFWIDHLDDKMTSVPLGLVVDDTEILVVSEDQTRICAPNEIGELWCRGGTVTLGYFGMQKKTEEHLVQSPFHSYPCKCWRTGDYGFKDEKGLLHYRGRRDHMVKVNGYRIEIGEVEQAVAAHSSLDEYAVVAIPDEKSGNKLFCYYSCIPGNHLEPADLKNFLATKIPSYFVPYRFILMPVMPKTSSGKIDRVLLANEARK